MKVSISGVRGVVGDSLKPSLICRFTRAFATYVGKGDIVIGRDTRRSGEMVEYAVRAGLLASGMSATTVGICPVPTIQLAVKNRRCRGGIAITASHNPAQWNALKFIKGSGHFLNQYQSEELLALYHQEEFNEVGTEKIRPFQHYSDAIEDHIREIKERIRPASGPRLRVVVDCCNGAGSVMSPGLLRELGCEVIELHCEPNGYFPRPPEPVPANLTDLKKAVIEHRADVGFAQDADADRLAIVSEKGEAIGEEYTLALCTLHILSHERGTVACNLSTSRMIDDIAGRFGCPVLRTKIGEVNVTEKMLEADALIGGEGNGGVIFPRVNMARDSFVAMTLILELMRERGQTVSQLTRLFPAYRMDKAALGIHPHRISNLIDDLAVIYSNEETNNLDGLKIERPDGWIHLRPSNTEPIMRVVIEAKDQATLKRYQAEIAEKIG
ncbi:MAG: phosphoglucosamine mutase [Acidobacteriota bacterium]|nr:MAG: phosphoglucosamine mutase [Acidobacteriota bacterium]